MWLVNHNSVRVCLCGCPNFLINLFSISSVLNAVKVNAKDAERDVRYSVHG